MSLKFTVSGVQKYEIKMIYELMIATLRDQDPLLKPTLLREAMGDDNEGNDLDRANIHDCYAQITFREFVIYLVTMAYFLFNRDLA